MSEATELAAAAGSADALGVSKQAVHKKHAGRALVSASRED